MGGGGMGEGTGATSTSPKFDTFLHCVIHSVVNIF